MKSIYLFLVVTALFFSACSTTSHLPEGEVLYTGVKKIEVVDEKNKKQNETALSEVEAALSVAPNNAIFGSNSLRWPFPLGLWMNNWLYKYKYLVKW